MEVVKRSNGSVFMNGILEKTYRKNKPLKHSARNHATRRKKVNRKR
jgi:hypothetical protein